jgi:hypothetical protein
MTPRNMETKRSYPVNGDIRYHKVAALLKPKALAIRYMVKGKPYISMYNATMNAK